MTAIYPPTCRQRRGGPRALRAGLLAGAAMMLAACNTTASRDVTHSVPPDYRMRHPIVLSEAEKTHEIFIGKSRSGLTPTQRNEVYAFAREWKHDATGGIVIELPSGAKNAYAARESLGEIRAALVAGGVPASGIVETPNRASDPRTFSSIKLVYPRVAAEAGPCGLWPKDLGPTWDSGHELNRPYWNLGCAMQRNTAAMVANPADLVQPRGEGSVLTSRRTVVLDKYRRGESTATTYPQNASGKISTIGQ